MTEIDQIQTLEDLFDRQEDKSLYVTWCILGDESDDLSDRLTEAGDSLQDMFDRFSMYPIKIGEDEKLFTARFEWLRYARDLQFSEAQLGSGECYGWIDFLCGFPFLGASELLVWVGEYSSQQELKDGLLAAIKSEDAAAPPIPEDLFEGYQDDRIILDYRYIDDPQDTKDRSMWVDGLESEPEPEGLHWWIRINFADMDDKKYPVPGEFAALANRQWPALPWGEQKSSPYLFSGNWIDTAYYTSGKILEVNQPTDERNYYTYTVQWRRYIVENVRSSDFNIYQVGDRVTIVKDAAIEKDSQLWKDSDMTEFGESWVIVPVMFYDINNRPEAE